MSDIFKKVKSIASRKGMGEDLVEDLEKSTAKQKKIESKKVATADEARKVIEEMLGGGKKK